jgi:hypothetical protein
VDPKKYFKELQIMSSCLLEVASNRKNKISLTDYNYQKDIENRLLMAHFSDTDLEVLEEILYSSIQIPIAKLSKNLQKEEQEILPSLEKLSKTGLFVFADGSIVVDKDMRKYFECQLEKFDEDFQPGMEFLQNLLKKVPIHVLPIWYAIPRTSNNIFDSLVEKYLLTPQIFQRYIMELNFGEPILKNIIQDVFSSENLELSSAELIRKYNISRELFEEYLLHLEFSFVCCLGYRKSEDGWEEKVTPFQEWKDYLKFLNDSEAPSIENTDKIQLKRPSEYSFVQDLAIILEQAKKQPITLKSTEDGFLLPEEGFLSKLLSLFPSLNKDPDFYRPYIHHLIQKLELVRLCSISQGKLSTSDMTEEWLSMRLDNQSLYLYRHPKNRILNPEVPMDLCTEKAMREAEKSIVRVLHKNWVFLDDFLQGVYVPLHESHAIQLTRQGKNWKYKLPVYSEAEVNLLRFIILEWLFEAGIVQIGSFHNKDCFRVTTLGQTLFAR